jgi:hypothetical protein
MSTSDGVVAGQSVPAAESSWWLTVWCAALVLVAAFSVIYIPAVGRGFIKDDFGWIAQSRITSIADALNLLHTAPSGFFRPMVSLSFGANRPVCGLDPFCYGVSNILLALGCALGVYTLARALDLPRGGALVASAIWGFNWHGINMSLQWISGRTALVLVLFATFAAAAFLKGRGWLAALLCLGAMLAKEEGVLLPAILIAVSSITSRIDGRQKSGALMRFIAGGAMAEGVYFYLRSGSGAFVPATAPSFYRFAFSPGLIATNALQYLDRTATFAVVVALFWVVVTRSRLPLTPRAIRVMVFGSLWWVGTLAITVLLPVRSSLYACLPSVGVALTVAVLLTESFALVSSRSARRAVAAGLLLPFLLLPIYYSRARRTRLEAELSTTTVAVLQQVAARLGAGASVRLFDNRAERPSLGNPFGASIQQAADLLIRPPISVWIEPPPDDAVVAGLRPPSRVDIDLSLQNGKIVAGARTTAFEP